jgi:putative peptidoglycan lipid II flippase
MDINNEGVKDVMLLSFPIILSLGSAQLNDVINKLFALSISGGETTILKYSLTIWFFPVGIFAVAISTIIFPRISRQAAKNQIENLKETFLTGAKLVNFLLIPSSLGIIFLANPIVKLLFERGEFTPNNTISTATVLSYLALSLVPYGILLILNRTFFALKDSRTPLKVSIFSIFCTIVFNLIFIRFLKTAGLALSYSLVITINFLILYLLLRRKIGRLGGKDILISSLKIFLASIIMALVAFFTNKLIYNLLTSYNFGLLFSVLISIALALVVYVALCFILKIEELKAFIQVIKERFRAT